MNAWMPKRSAIAGSGTGGNKEAKAPPLRMSAHDRSRVSPPTVSRTRSTPCAKFSNRWVLSSTTMSAPNSRTLSTFAVDAVAMTCAPACLASCTARFGAWIGDYEMGRGGSRGIDSARCAEWSGRDVPLDFSAGGLDRLFVSCRDGGVHVPHDETRIHARRGEGHRQRVGVKNELAARRGGHGEQ